jgi:hypothetical protein
LAIKRSTHAGRMPVFQEILKQQMLIVDESRLPDSSTIKQKAGFPRAGVFYVLPVI